MFTRSQAVNQSEPPLAERDVMDSPSDSTMEERLRLLRGEERTTDPTDTQGAVAASLDLPSNITPSIPIRQALYGTWEARRTPATLIQQRRDYQDRGVDQQQTTHVQRIETAESSQTRNTGRQFPTTLRILKDEFKISKGNWN